MSEFSWDPQLETGIASIAAQHRELFQSAEALHAACSAGNRARLMATYDLQWLDLGLKSLDFLPVLGSASEDRAFVAGTGFHCSRLLKVKDG